MGPAEPCPFCGEQNALGVGRSTEDREGWPTYVYCGSCGAHGPWAYIDRERKGVWTCTALAADATGWNDRHLTAALRGLIADWRDRVSLTGDTDYDIGYDAAADALADELKAILDHAPK